MAIQEGAASQPEGQPNPVLVPKEEAVTCAGEKPTSHENRDDGLDGRLQAGDVSGGKYVQHLEQGKDEVDSLKKVAVLSLDGSPEKAGVVHIPANSIAT